MRETCVQSLGWEDPPEKGTATTPVFSPEEFHGLYSTWGGKEWDQLSLSLPSIHCLHRAPQKTYLRKLGETLAPWKESYDQPRQHIQKRRHYFANKGPSSQGYGLSSGHGGDHWTMEVSTGLWR